MTPSRLLASLDRAREIYKTKDSRFLRELRTAIEQDRELITDYRAVALGDMRIRLINRELRQRGEEE